MKSLFSTVSLAFCLVSFALPSLAEGTHVSIGINGISCPTCAFSLQKGLRRLDGIAETQLITSKPVHVEITLKQGVWIEPARFARQVSDAGFAARMDDVYFTVSGKVSRDGERLLFTVSGLGAEAQTFVLVPFQPKDARDTKAYESILKEAEACNGQSVEIEGMWKASKEKNGPATLGVRRITALTVSVASK